MATGTHTTKGVICHCLGVTKSQLQRAAAEGDAETIRSVMNHTGAGTGCTACHPAIRAILAQASERAQCASSSPT